MHEITMGGRKRRRNAPEAAGAVNQGLPRHINQLQPPLLPGALSTHLIRRKTNKTPRFFVRATKQGERCDMSGVRSTRFFEKRSRWAVRIVMI